MNVNKILLNSGDVLHIENKDNQYIKFEPINSSGITVADFRSKKAIEEANKITAYSLTKDAD